MVVGEEIRVPICLLEPATVDGPDPTIYAIHADLIRPKPDYGTMFLMGGMYGLILFPAVSHPQYPSRGKRSSKVSSRDLGQWREQRWL